MIYFIILALVLWAAVKTKPDRTSFRRFLEQKHKQESRKDQSLLSQISSFLAPSSRAIPEFKCDDYYFFVSVQVENGKVYLGIFNSWFDITTLVSTSATSSDSGAVGNAASIEDKADMETETAKQERLRGNHLKAAKHYNEAAKLLSNLSSDDIPAQLQRAEAYENASKMLKQAGKLQQARTALTEAARICANHDRLYTRAARLYESAGVLAADDKDWNAVIDYYTRAMELFRQADDGRWMSLYVKIADAYGENGQYRSCYDYYLKAAENAVSVSTLRFSVNAHCVNAWIAGIAQDEQPMNVLQGLGDQISAFPLSDDYKICDVCLTRDVQLFKCGVKQTDD